MRPPLDQRTHGHSLIDAYSTPRYRRRSLLTRVSAFSRHLAVSDDLEHLRTAGGLLVEPQGAALHVVWSYGARLLSDVQRRGRHPPADGPDNSRTAAPDESSPTDSTLTGFAERPAFSDDSAPGSPANDRRPRVNLRWHGLPSTTTLLSGSKLFAEPNYLLTCPSHTTSRHRDALPRLPRSARHLPDPAPPRSISTLSTCTAPRPRSERSCAYALEAHPAACTRSNFSRPSLPQPGSLQALVADHALASPGPACPWPAPSQLRRASERAFRASL